MLLMILRTAIRTQLRQRGYALLNVLGLAVGLATCLIIFTVVASELTWDRSLDPDGSLYRLNQTLAFPGTEEQVIANSASAFGPVMTQRVPEVLAFTRLWGMHTATVTREHDDPFVLNQLCLADSSFFRLFSYPLLAGTAERALREPNGIVLREDIARALFPGGDALGSVLTCDDGMAVTVTGVYQVPEPGSFFEPKGILRLDALGHDLMSWQDHSWTTFVRLADGADPQAVMATALERMPERQDQDVVTPWLQPFSRIHLHGDGITNQLNAHPGSFRLVAGFSAIAVLILILAAINFINISTATAIPRSHEVSLRKVMGASRRSLILQGLGESVALAFVAMLVATLLVELTEPLVSDLVGREFHIFRGDPVQLALLIGLPLLAGLAGGLYPALLLASFQPVATLKGLTPMTSSRGLLRRGLVLLQFVLSTILIIVTVALYTQLDQLRKTGFGIRTDSVILLENSDHELNPAVLTLASEMRRHPDVEAVGVSQSIPSGGNWEITVSPEGMDEPAITHAMAIDRGTAGVFGLKLLAGRWFDVDSFPGDGLRFEGGQGASLVINQQFAEMAGWDDPIGKTVRFWDRTFTVVGVIENFHHRNLYHPFHPMLIYSGPEMGRFLSVRTLPGKATAVKQEIANRWAQLTREAPVSLHLADGLYEVHYRTERIAATYLRVFSVLAVLIATLGLLGMTAISATRRLREIGIRKVLGANAGQILRLLNREFMLLVLFANVIAWPVSVLLLQSWLNRFVIELPFPWWVFPLCSGGIIAVAALTTTLLGLRYARIHPALTLRHE